MKNKPITRLNAHKTGSRAIMPLFLALALFVISAPGYAGFGFVHGYVYARTTVTNDAGNYTWGEFDPATGAYLRDIGEATGDGLDPAQWRVMSGDEYRSHVKVKTSLHEAQNDLLLMSRADYQGANLLLADGSAMSKPGLSQTTAYVSILPPARRFIDDPDSLILAEYPIDPSVSIADDILSMLHKFVGSNIGETKSATTNRIGFKTAFAKDEAGDPVAIDDNVQVSPAYGYEAAGPIEGATVEYWNYATLTGDDGAFALFWPTIPCFGFATVTIHSSILLKLKYRSFNPKRSAYGGTYYKFSPISEVCVPTFYIVPIIGPIPIWYESSTYPTEPIQFRIDRTLLTGTAQLSAQVDTQGNKVILYGEKVPVGGATQYKTQYSTDSGGPDNSKVITGGYDFDRDGLPDTIIAGHLEPDPAAPAEDPNKKIFVQGEPKELQGVWLSSAGIDSQVDQPSFTRVMDSASYANYQHQGLLAQISAEDLRNTDLYVVRVSDGKLISERIGLNEYEAEHLFGDASDFGEDSNSNRFFYTLQIQGSKEYNFLYNGFNDGTNFTDWQSSSGINPELHQRQADHLQPGDAIRIYAINRATGYIGHTDTKMQANLTNGDLDFRIAPIVMGPPNLKIRAERDYKIQSGVTASDDTITQLIGFEGVSLTSDTTVTIITEWLDHQGRPMPESLEGAGYTGRIAFLSGNQTLPNDNQGVYQFNIDPGRRLQVLQLPNALTTDSEHFYIHVSGEPKSGNPIFAGNTNSARLREADFSSSGQNPGILAKRPDNYVPFLVPLFDEKNTELQTQAYHLLKQTNPEQFTEAPDPIYKWVYRPEMQFSSYDLTVSAINKSHDTNADGIIDAGETINILNDETPLITGDSMIDILYGLSTTDLLPLDYFNAGDSKELVFVIGEQEVTATLGENQQIIFDDLSFLDLLSPDDFLTIRLYANNDMGNVLWEWAFMNLDVDVDSDNNNGLGLPDRNDEEEQIENIESHPGKILFVNRDDTDADGIPDYADFDAGEGFVPMVVQIPDEVDVATARIKFTYEQSDPTIINVDATVDPPKYDPDTGYLRIWTKNGTEVRNTNDVSAGGHFIRSEQVINLTLFSIDADGVIVLYTELVRDKDIWGGMKTRIEIIE